MLFRLWVLLESSGEYLFCFVVATNQVQTASSVLPSVGNDAYGSSEVRGNDSERSEVTWPRLLRKGELGWLPGLMLSKTDIFSGLHLHLSGSHFPLDSIGQASMTQSCDDSFLISGLLWKRRYQSE